MDGVQYAHEPKYRALLLRRNYSDLALPGALMDRSHEWWGPTDAKWHAQDKSWEFPSGASITFGYLDKPNDRFRYQGAEFHYVGFDELTQFPEVAYRYLFSRVRRLAGSDVPIRLRGATNPGGVGHEWVSARFGLGIPRNAAQAEEYRRIRRTRPFVPARLEDNPYLDREEYERALAELDPVTRAQLRRGDWSIKPTGAFFDRSLALLVEEPPERRLLRLVRFWDLAATEGAGDWTVGLLLGRTQEDDYYVLDVVRGRWGPQNVEKQMRRTAESDGRGVSIRWEQEPGAAGKAFSDHLMRRVLPGYDTEAVPSSGDKATRARGVSAAWANGRVRLVAGPWVSDFLDETDTFPPDPPGSLHDDQVDALSGAFHSLSRRRDTQGLVEIAHQTVGSAVAPAPRSPHLHSGTSLLHRRF